MEPLHGLESTCMDEGLKGLGESQGRLGESYEDGHELDELMNNSASPLKIALNSASRSKTRQVG